MERTLRANWNLVSDARKQAKELADKGRVFALFLRVHHRDIFPESAPATGGAAKRKPRPAKRAVKEVSTVQAASKVKEVRFKEEASGAASSKRSAGMAPCPLPREILEVIMGLLGSLSVDEVLRERQRMLDIVNVVDVGIVGYQRHLVMHGFPSLGLADNGYGWIRPSRSPTYTGLLLLQVQQRVTNNPLLAMRDLTWTVRVDLARVPVAEGTGDIVIPATAISIKTNVRDMQAHSNLSTARVEEMLGFRLRGRITDRGAQIRFEAEGVGPDSNLQFVAKTSIKYVNGMELDSHAGIRVGDRVRIVQAYKVYEDFAIGQEGVVRMMRLNSFVMYFVELAEEGAAISERVVAANGGRRIVHGQSSHHLVCQRFHLQALGRGDC